MDHVTRSRFIYPHQSTRAFGTDRLFIRVMREQDRATDGPSPTQPTRIFWGPLLTGFWREGISRFTAGRHLTHAPDQRATLMLQEESDHYMEWGSGTAGTMQRRTERQVGGAIADTAQ